MNRRDDCAEPLFATDSCEHVRSHAYGRLSKDSLRAKEQARARQHSCIMRASNTDTLNFSVLVAKSGWKGEMISGAKSIFTKDMSGFVELTELSDSHAKGKLVHTEKGDSKLTVEFDVVIEKDMLK